MNGDPGRRIGWTTAQIAGAPQGAFFVWPVLATSDYPKLIAEKLGRTDLRIIAPYFLPNLVGRDDIPAVVVDHAVQLKPEEREALHWINERIGRRA